MSGRHEADAPPDDPTQEQQGTDRARSDEAEGAGPGERRRHRRERTDAAPGSDPAPTPEPPRHSSGENDERLRADKPPHWQ
jgi:hypothetical protein